jgi:4-hydroxybenzoate polyprenyltransferase
LAAGAKDDVGGRSADIPLVVDLDALIRTDLSTESFSALLSQRLSIALAALPRLTKGKAPFKAYVADHAVLDLDTIPFDESVLDFVQAERAQGRRLYLISASDRRYVEELAARFGLFDGCFGSTAERNLSGRAKADLLCAEFGDGGFDYIGDDWDDLAVWVRCRRPITARAPPTSLLRQWRVDNPYMGALRPHQWLKNGLVFVPLLAGHQITLATLAAAFLAAFAFSLGASSAYLLNDLFDLAHDRDHATKRLRPMASGALPLRHGLAMSAVLFAGAAAIGYAVSPACLGLLAVYYAVTAAYSLHLKRRVLVDVLILAGLYTLRILVGSFGVGVPASPWLFAFSTFFFLCLALIKRTIELIGRFKRNAGDPGGRGYRLDDISVLSSLAAASGYCSILVLALYFHSAEVHVLYGNPDALWLTGPPLLYWVSRMLLLAHRGELHDDPVVFAATDWVSLCTGAIILAIMAAAS